MNVLVTGGTGFVGGHLVRRLVADGHTVRVGSRDAPTFLPSGATHVRVDVTEPSTVRPAMDGVDAVVHLTAIIVERGDQTFERVNVEGTRNVLAAMRDAGVERIVDLSALGAGPDQRFPYLLSKWHGEES